MSACAASQEALWLLRLLQEFRCQFSGPVTKLEDNEACIAFSKTPGNHDMTKHIDRKYNFVREQDEAGNIILLWTI